MKRIVITLVVAMLAIIVMPAAAQSFELTSPADELLVRDLSNDLDGFSWTPLAGATDYMLNVFRVSNNTREFGLIFTGTVNPASCSPTECVYVPTGPQYDSITRGSYAWTVVADTSGGSQEPGNAPFYFSYEDQPVALLQNTGFQSGALSPWVGKNLSGDKLKDNKGVGGGWGFQFKGSSTEKSKLKQKQNVAVYHIGSSDVIQFSADYIATSALIDGEFKIKIFYTPESGLAKDKISLFATQNTNFVNITQNVFPDGPVQFVGVDIKHKSPNGKFIVDNVSLTLLAVP